MTKIGEEEKEEVLPLMRFGKSVELERPVVAKVVEILTEEGLPLDLLDPKNGLRS